MGIHRSLKCPTSNLCTRSLLSPLQTRLAFIWILIGISTVIPGLSSYKYEYHNVLLNHFAYKEFHLRLPCKSLTMDNLRSGHLVFNLYCQRKAFRVKITAPSAADCGQVLESPTLYINIRSHFLEGNEVVDFSDPLLSGLKKRLTSNSKPHLIEDSLQSFGQLLTTGSTALLEYTPSNYAPSGCSKGGDSTFLELEYVLVTPMSSYVPSSSFNGKFTQCPALHGYIATGILCDQYSADRPLGCPLSVSSNSKELNPAQGQDRTGLNCYELVLEKDAQNILDLVEGRAVLLNSAVVSGGKFSLSFLTFAIMIALIRMY